MEKLAINGGIPSSSKPIYYGRQYISEDDCAAVVDVLKSDYLTTGPKIAALEEILCKLTDARYAVSISNGTTALHAAAYAAKIGVDDEVITTPMTFAATSNCVLYCGGTPVFADIDPNTYNISPASIREKITSKTKAVIAVDFTGQPAQLDEIRAICKKYNLIFIEDAAHSIGSKFNGQMVGNVADMTTFSFHPVKTVTSGEGGAILTNDEALYKKMMLFRTHGITRDVVQMVNEPDGPWYYEQIDLGYNYRLTDFQAALLISQLNKLDRFSARRKEIVKQYDAAFSQIPEVILQKEIPQSDATRHLYIIRLNSVKLRGTRKEIFDALAAENIICNVHYIPVYYHPYYQKLGYKKGLCPHAEKLYNEMISIPLYYTMEDEDVKNVINAVIKIINYFRK